MASPFIAGVQEMYRLALYIYAIRQITGGDAREDWGRKRIGTVGDKYLPGRLDFETKSNQHVRKGFV